MAGELTDLVHEWWEPFVWVRGGNFHLSPGTAVPLVGWPGSVADQPMIDALEKTGSAYRVVFTGADHHARAAAVSAGVGLMGLPERLVSAPLVAANESYLPPFSPVRAGICVGKSVDTEKIGSIIALLKGLAP